VLRIPKVEEELASQQKPRLDSINTPQFGKNDCLVLCAGFEDRAQVFLRSALASSYNRFRVLLIDYLPFMPENKSQEVQQLCRAAGLDYAELIYDRQDPAGFGDIFCQALGTVDGRLYIDVSGMSRLLIVQILVSLASCPNGFSRSAVLYAEAGEYPPGITTVQDAIDKSDVDPLYSIMLLSSGVFEVTIVPELLSISLDGQQTRLVAFPSFNTDQLTALRNELQPSRYSIIHGVPPAHDNKWRTNAIAKLNHIDSMKGEDIYYTSTLDYRETLDCLLRIYNRYGAAERILIAPTGSKMQTVAVAVFRAFIRDVQIVYPTPREFTSPTSYTIGIGNRYQLLLDSFVIPGAPPPATDGLSATNL
jgi:hypothetical protein